MFLKISGRNCPVVPPGAALVQLPSVKSIVQSSTSENTEDHSNEWLNANILE